MKTSDFELTFTQASKTSSIIVRSGLLQDLKMHLSLENYSKIAVLTDKNVAKEWLGPLRDALGADISIITTEPGEKAKSLREAEAVWKQLAELGFDRYSLLIAFGGGVIGDLGGFVASLFSRGMSLVHLPTSLMAQVDSSIGAKSAVNLSGLKNQIGSFYPPDYVFVDPQFLQTLPQREVVSGFAEVIKHALLFDKEMSEKLCKVGLGLVLGPDLELIITESIRVKTAIVEQDPFELSGERQLLNFGHTVGHAFEALSLATESPLAHGEAVSLGMLCETEISRRLGYLSADDVEFVRNLLSTFSLPTSSELCEREDELIELISHDKKSRAGEVRWALLEAIGVGKHSVTVDEELVRESFSILAQHGDA